MPQSSDLTYRIWSSADGSTDDLLTFMNTLKNRNHSLSWLAQKTSWGLGAVGAMAEFKGAPAGLLLFGADSYEVGGRPADGALVYDTFVHADHRGKGIFRKLLALAQNACRTRGFEFLLAFPNDSSRPGFVNAGWVALPPMERYVHAVLPRGPLASLRRARQLRASLQEEFLPISGFSLADQVIDRFDVAKQPPIGLVHSTTSDALSFRFHPDRGEGYLGLMTSTEAAIVRVGVRGSVREAQILTTTPRGISAGRLRRLSGEIVRSTECDVVTYIESGARGRAGRLLSGFVGLGARTTPFYKGLTSPDAPEGVLLGGIDVHTW